MEQPIMKIKLSSFDVRIQVQLQKDFKLVLIVYAFIKPIS